MGKPSKAVLQFMEQYKVDSDEIWEVHGSSWVVKHRALERVAAEQGIAWDRPAMIETNSQEGIVAICVFGKLGERSEWSIGEASPKNCKNSYFYAMAEKRAKDRVILKLLAAHGSLYSESEADEFAEQPKRQNPHVTRPEDVFGQIDKTDNIPEPTTFKKLTVAEQRPIFKELQDEIQRTGSIKELKQWAQQNKDRLGALKPDWQDFLRGVYAEHMQAIQILEQGDQMRAAQ